MADVLVVVSSHHQSPRCGVSRFLHGKCCCCQLVSSIAKLRCFAVSVGTVHSDSTVSVVGFEGQSKR